MSSSSPHRYDPLQDPPPPLPYPPENPRLNPVRSSNATSQGSVRSSPFSQRLAGSAGTTGLSERQLENIHLALQDVSDDVRTTLHEFSGLARRSKDNGEQLQLLMTEIRGVREDDGVSRKLTGLAQLDRLTELTRLNKLDSIPPPKYFSQLEDQIRALSDTIGSINSAATEDKASAKANQSRDLETQIKALSELNYRVEKLADLGKNTDTKIDKLTHSLETTKSNSTGDEAQSNLLGSIVGQLEVIRQLAENTSEMQKSDQVNGMKMQLQTIDHLNEIKIKTQNLEPQNSQNHLQLEDVQNVTENCLSDVKQTLTKILDQYDQQSNASQTSWQNQTKDMSELKTAASQTADQLKTLPEIKNQLQHLGKLDIINSQLEHLQLLRQLSHLDALDQLPEIKSQLSQLSQLGKQQADKSAALDGLATKLNSLDSGKDMKELQGEIRAVQDHMLGIHKNALSDLKEAGELKARQSSVEELRQEELELKSRVESLRKQECELQSHVSQLKSELRSHVEKLEDTESRYSHLESSLRDMTLAKYKGVLASGTMAVLSNSSYKENQPPMHAQQDFIIPKRQLRTVSLMDRT